MPSLSPQTTTVYINRYTEFIPIVSGYKLKYIMIFHDLLRSFERLSNLKYLSHILVLSQFHRLHLEQHLVSQKTDGVCASIPVEVIHYGIHPVSQDPYDWTPWQPAPIFIYTSFANRGLLQALQIFNQIKSAVPQAVFHICCDIKHPWLLEHHKDLVEQITPLLSSPGVIHYGWVAYPQLVQLWKQSSIWLYPNTFQETFCLSALQAGITKTLAITTDNGSLSEVVGERGYLLPIEHFVDCILNILRNPVEAEKARNKVEENYRWALGHRWGEHYPKVDSALTLKK
jgi:hypothetical protein